MLDYHRAPELDTCDVCQYVVTHDLDCAYEHSLVRLATLSLLEDLGALDGETTRLSAVAVGSSGLEPGPVHALDPRHWFWAMLYEPDIRISVRGRPR